MATWNVDKPTLTDTIAADIPDIEENFQELHDVIEAITNGTLGTTTAADFRVDVLADGADCGTAPTMTSPVITTGVNDGTNAISFPTNNMGACKFLTGESTTIIWMYLNTAPKGWKALTTGADKLIGIVGGSGAYNVNGGNVAGTSFDNLEAHTHTYNTVIAHTHTVAGNSVSGGTINALTSTGTQAGGAIEKASSSTGSASGTTAASSLTEARPTAALGKLFQFDTS